jgi:hypothetical protein
MLQDTTSSPDDGAASLSPEPPGSRAADGDPAFRWMGSPGCWPFFVRLLLWSMRKSRSRGGKGASSELGTGDRRTGREASGVGAFV